MESPLKYFAAMEDHRKQGYVKHPMINIIAISIAAVICGAAAAFRMMLPEAAK